MKKIALMFTVLICLLSVCSVAYGKVLLEFANTQTTDLSDWESGEDMEWEVITDKNNPDVGAIEAKTNSANTYLVSKSFRTPDVFKASVKMKFPAENLWAGIVFNFDNPDLYYVVRFKSGSQWFQVLRIVDGAVPENIWEKPGKTYNNFIPVGSWVDLIFTFDGSKFAVTMKTMFGEQTMMMDVLSPIQPVGGKFGLFSRNAGILFKDLKVETL